MAGPQVWVRREQSCHSSLDFKSVLGRLEITIWSKEFLGRVILTGTGGLLYRVPYWFILKDLIVWNVRLDIGMCPICYSFDVLKLGCADNTKTMSFEKSILCPETMPNHICYYSFKPGCHWEVSLWSGGPDFRLTRFSTKTAIKYSLPRSLHTCYTLILLLWSDNKIECVHTTA